MAQNILIIGAVALGTKAACRCKRLAPESHVVIVDENALISYGGCGIPYYMSGEIASLDDLRATPYHTVRDEHFFDTMKGVTVHTQCRALAINRTEKTVRVRDVQSGDERLLPYDTLVLATGASPRIPAVPGVDLAGVYAVTRLEAARDIRSACESGKVRKAVIVGGGFIGLECAVALADMWGVECAVIEMADQLLPGVVSASLAQMVRHDCTKHKVNVYTGQSLTRIEGDRGSVARVITSQQIVEADLVILAAGFVPNSMLAREAGLAVADFGGICVNEYMQTTDPNIYAGGDCIALTHAVTGQTTYAPLGSMANRQGRVIGTNAAGGTMRFGKAVGTWAVKLFGMSFCGAGLSPEKARAAGFDALGVAVEQLDRAHFYPEKSMMYLEIVVDRATRRVLGIQGACIDGIALKARIDAVAALLQYASPTIDDIANMEVAYSPPFASAMDVVNTVANVADNVLAGRFAPVTAAEFMELWHNRAHNDVFFIDARPHAASKAVEAAFPDWHGIPLEEIAARIADIPKGSPVALICNTGLRAYDAQLILQRNGITTVNTMGGMVAAGKMGLGPA